MSANDETAAVCARVAKALTKKVPFVAPADLRHLLRCAEAWEASQSAIVTDSDGDSFQLRSGALWTDIGGRWRLASCSLSSHIESAERAGRDVDAALLRSLESPAAVLSALDAQEGKSDA